LKIIVDTCIWSEALRRQAEVRPNIHEELKKLILQQWVQMIGPVRQELLLGIRSKKQFNDLKSYLSAFPDLPVQTGDYELAAEYFNLCRKNGIQGSNTDFLICALSSRYQFPVFTSDQDFSLYSEYIPVILYKS
jgi:predicted nucleic acid-binding protein